MPKEIPSNTQAIITGWGDLVRVIRDMPLQCLIAVAVCGAAAVVEMMLGSGLTLSGRDLGIRLVVSVAEAFLLTPVLISVHRLIILGERPSGYAVAPGRPRFMRFFGWSAALLLVTWLATLVPALLVSDAALRFIILLVLGVASIVISVRFVLLFPALAVDAPGAHWSNAWADSRDHGLDIFLIFLGAFVPLFVLALIVLPLLQAPPGGGAGVWTLAMSVPLALGYILAVVIASRLYGWLADKLGQG